MALVSTASRRTTILTPLVPTACHRLVPTADYRTTVLADSPVGYWKLDDATGTTAVDSSGNAHDGTYENSPTLGVSPLITTGNAVTFNGSTQDVSIPWNAAFQPTNRFSFEAWIKTSAANGTIGCLFTGSGGGDLFYVALTSGKIEFDLWDSGDNGHQFLGSITLNDNVHHHVVCYYDGTKMLCSVDGALDGAGVSASITLETVSTAIQIGVRKNNVGTRSGGFAGTIDEVALYTTAPTQSRWLAHYNAGIS